MRNIEENMCQAIRARKSWRERNTEVKAIRNSDERIKQLQVLLHGHMIARVEYISCGELMPDRVAQVNLSFCGYHTPTTRSRINAVIDALGLPLTAFIHDFAAHIAPWAIARKEQEKWGAVIEYICLGMDGWTAEERFTGEK